MKLIEAAEVNVQFGDVGFTHLRVIYKHISRYIVRHKERSGGVHVSDILKYCWFGSLPVGSKERSEKEREAAEELGDDRIMPLRMFLGMAAELGIVGLYPEMVWQPGELKKDGVSGSPDGRRSVKANDATVPVISEVKCTWKSCKDRDILKETLWLWQIKSYLKQAQDCWQMPELRHGEMHVLYVNGIYDYFKGGAPRYIRYLIEFSQSEIDRHWLNVILRNRDKAAELNEVSK